MREKQKTRMAWGGVIARREVVPLMQPSLFLDFLGCFVTPFLAMTIPTAFTQSLRLLSMTTFFLLAIPRATFATTTHTTPSSLFFKEEEIAHIQEDKCDVLKSEEIKLFAILYTDDQHWSLWINDKVIRPENRHDLRGVRIKKVTLDEVTFSYTSSKDAGVKTFTLRPHSVRGTCSENET